MFFLLRIALFGISCPVNELHLVGGVHDAHRALHSTVIINPGVTSIGNLAFWYHTNLSNVTISSTVKTIDGCAFLGCTSLLEIDIPEGVTSILGSAFWRCSNLETISLPSSLTTFWVNAITDCPSLSYILVDEASTTFSSVDGVLYNRAGTTLLRYPPARDAAAYTVPNSVTIIGEHAFSGNVFLESVTFGKNINRIRGFAFSNCSNLKKVYFRDDAPTVVEMSEYDNSFPETAALYYPTSATDWSTPTWEGYIAYPYEDEGNSSETQSETDLLLERIKKLDHPIG